MASSRQWAEEENFKLIDLIELNYENLFEDLPMKSKQMVEKRWSEIVLQINALGASSPALSVKQFKKK